MEHQPVPRTRDEEVYTTEEVAQWLKVRAKTVREWIGRGELAAWSAGQGYRIFQRDLDAFIERRMRPRRGLEPPGASPT